MAETKTALEFTGEQAQTIEKLASTLRLTAGVLAILGLLNLAQGVMTLLSWASLVSLVVGVVNVLMALMLLTSARDMSYMVRTKYAPYHLSNGLQDLATLYKTQFGIAMFLVLVTVVLVAFR